MFKKAGLLCGLALVLAACSPRYKLAGKSMCGRPCGGAAFPDRVMTDNPGILRLGYPISLRLYYPGDPPPWGKRVRDRSAPAAA